jgi:hypothetical protein
MQIHCLMLHYVGGWKRSAFATPSYGYPESYNPINRFGIMVLYDVSFYLHWDCIVRKDICSPEIPHQISTFCYGRRIQLLFNSIITGKVLRNDA